MNSSILAQTSELLNVACPVLQPIKFDNYGKTLRIFHQFDSVLHDFVSLFLSMGKMEEITYSFNSLDLKEAKSVEMLNNQRAQ